MLIKTTRKCQYSTLAFSCKNENYKFRSGINNGIITIIVTCNHSVTLKTLYNLNYLFQEINPQKRQQKTNCYKLNVSIFQLLII